MRQFRKEFMVLWSKMTDGVSGGGDWDARLREVLFAWYGVHDIGHVRLEHLGGRGLRWLRSLDVAGFSQAVHEA